jgi:hypothetical protein
VPVAAHAADASGTVSRSRPLAPGHPSRTHPGRSRALSGHGSTTVAGARTRALVRQRPLVGAPPVARLHYSTEDLLPEVYLLLRSYRDPRGREWIQLRLPERPSGHIGWVPRAALGALRVVRTRLVVDRAAERLTLYRGHRKLFTARAGVGAPSTPTPAGSFWVREKFRVLHAPFYGPYAIGTSAYANVSDWPGAGVVGIHGTSQPQQIPGRPSHGCVRLRNRAISRLFWRVPIGTPIQVV